LPRLPARIIDYIWAKYGNGRLVLKPTIPTSRNISTRSFRHRHVPAGDGANMPDPAQPLPGRTTPDDGAGPDARPIDAGARLPGGAAESPTSVPGGAEFTIADIMLVFTLPTMRLF